MSVNGSIVTTAEEVINAIRANAAEGESLSINTTTGSYQVSPKAAIIEQCYWQVSGGPVQRSGAALFVGPYGASGGANTVANQRFFRASCRTYDRFVATCTTNWQE